MTKFIDKSGIKKEKKESKKTEFKWGVKYKHENLGIEPVSIWIISKRRQLDELDTRIFL